MNQLNPPPSVEDIKNLPYPSDMVKAEMLRTTTNAGGDCEQLQVTSFLDANDEAVMTIPTGIDPTVYQTSDANASLKEFFARPVLIKSFDWSNAANPEFQINPWYLWANDAYVKQKLSRFSLFRGELMIKVTVNGSPFHYGKALLHYWPLKGFSDLTDDATGAAELTNESIGLLCKASQRLHVKIDPSTNVAGCMCLPFLWPSNMIRIPYSADWNNMGTLNLTQMCTIRSTGALFVAPEINIYAYVQNAQVQVPTRSEPLTLSPLSFLLPKPEGTEYDDEGGPISGPAATVAAVAGQLSDAPVIGRFAMATSIGASAVSNIAKLFGFSKPSTTIAPSQMRREPIGSFANTQGSDTVNKLSLDPRQEVTVDSRTIGLSGQDEMTIQSLVKRKALLTQFTWAMTDTAHIFQANVSPYPAVELGTATLAENYNFTPLTFASLPFQFWSGTIIYTFEVMCSQMHRGRLGIMFDPVDAAGTIGTRTNALYTTVLDLEKTKNVKIAVSWANGEPYLVVRPGNFASGQVQTATDAFVPMTSGSNGFIGVNVLNKLTCNTTGQDVKINVYVEAGDDFQLFGPDDAALNRMSYFPVAASPLALLLPFFGVKAEGETADGEADGALDAPVEVALVPQSMTTHDMKLAIHCGDPVTSFRNLLKRYNCSEVIQFRNDTVDNFVDAVFRYKYRECNFPRYKGYDPNGLYQVGVAVPFTPSLNTLLNYLTPAYVAWRGGLRIKYVPIGARTVNGAMFQESVERTPINASVGYSKTLIYSSLYTDMNQSAASACYHYDLPLNAGALIEYPKQQTILALELPYYSPKRFAFAQNLDMNSGTMEDFSKTFKHTIRHTSANLVQLGSGANTLNPHTGMYQQDTGYSKFVAAGDDFSLMGFVNVPTMYIYTTALPTITKDIEVVNGVL